MAVIDLLRQYLSAGFSVIPIKADGSKAPVRAWSQYQRRRADESELDRLFAGDCGVAIVCGQVSGGIEVFDFDAPHSFDRWSQDLSAAGGSLDEWPIVQTPKGFGRHVYVRRQVAGEGRKLARSESGDTMIEIRGEGNYVIAPGSPGACHPTGNTYLELTSPVASLRLEPIGEAEYALWVSCAKAMNRRVEEVNLGPTDVVRDPLTSLRPGDDYSRRASWKEILEPHGWLELRRGRDGAVIWQRPGKDERDTGGSATTGYCRSEGGGDLLYVFSSNAPPFEAGRCYSKFTARALLGHRGDFRQLAKDLAREGYGGVSGDPSALERALEACRGEAGRRFPEGRVEAMTANDPGFRATFGRQRKDFEGGAQELIDRRYMLALVRAGVMARLSEEGIARLLWQHYEDHELEPQISLTSQDLAACLAAVLERRGLEDIKLISEVEAEEVISAAEEEGSIEPVLDELEKRLGFRVTGMVQSEVGSGHYTLECEDGDEVVIGAVERVMSPAQFAARVYEHLGRLLPAATRKPMGWEVVLSLLAQVRRVAQPDVTRRSEAEELLAGYTQGHLELEGEEWKEAAVIGDPFIREGRLYVHAPSFRRWIRQYHGDRLSAPAVREMLRACGMHPRALSFRYGATSRVVTRSLFERSHAIGKGNGPPDDFGGGDSVACDTYIDHESTQPVDAEGFTCNNAIDYTDT